MPVKVYKDRWSIVGTDVVNYVREFFQTEKFTKVINHTFLVFIPKKQNAHALTITGQ